MADRALLPKFVNNSSLRHELRKQRGHSQNIRNLVPLFDVKFRNTRAAIVQERQIGGTSPIRVLMLNLKRSLPSRQYSSPNEPFEQVGPGSRRAAVTIGTFSAPERGSCGRRVRNCRHCSPALPMLANL